VEIGILERECNGCRRKMTVDIYRRMVKVYDNNDELIHTYKRISEWGLREDGSIKSPIDYMLDYYHDEENDCPLCNGEEVDILKRFKQDVKPVLMKLKRIWKVINEFKEYVEINKLKDSRKTLASLVYMVSDFEVSLATDYQELYKHLDKSLVFDTICREKVC
jgi:hypothetical protein